MSNPMSPSNALKTPRHLERIHKTSKGHYEINNDMGDQSGGRKVTGSKKKKHRKYKVRVAEVKPMTQREKDLVLPQISITPQEHSLTRSVSSGEDYSIKSPPSPHITMTVEIRSNHDVSFADDHDLERGHRCPDYE